MADVCKVEVFVVVDSDGNYSIGMTEEAAGEQYDSDGNTALGRRVILLTVDVPLPVVVELHGIAPEQGTVGKLAVREGK
jgi:hypothetical protein